MRPAPGTSTDRERRARGDLGEGSPEGRTRSGETAAAGEKGRAAGRAAVFLRIPKSASPGIAPGQRVSTGAPAVQVCRVQGDVAFSAPPFSSAR